MGCQCGVVGECLNDGGIGGGHIIAGLEEEEGVG